MQVELLSLTFIHLMYVHHHLCISAGGLGMWVKEKASMTGRRWRSALWGRKNIKSFLHTEVSIASTTDMKPWCVKRV